jgi:RNA polymerase sigma factor (sigma-70 family)
MVSLSPPRAIRPARDESPRGRSTSPRETLRDVISATVAERRGPVRSTADASAAPGANAFWATWLEHRAYLAAVCRREMRGRRADADDALSTAMMLAARRMPGCAASILCARAWLVTLVRRVCIDLRREAQRRARGEAAAADARGEVSADDHARTGAEAGAWLKQAVAALPPRLRAPAHLRWIETLQHAEVARRLGLSEACTRKRIEEARRMLRAAAAREATPRPQPGAREKDAPLAKPPATESRPEHRRAPARVVQRGRLRQRLATLAAYVARHPGGWRKRLERAQLLEQAGRLPEAIAEYNLILQKRPQLEAAAGRLAALSASAALAESSPPKSQNSHPAGEPRLLSLEIRRPRRFAQREHFRPRGAATDAPSARLSTVPMAIKSAQLAANAPAAVVNLQNQWYNTLRAAVGGNGSFQIIQPSAPMPPNATDDQVWQYFNNLPPAALNNNLTLSGGDQFYTDYTAVLSQLQSHALTNFQNVLGSYYPLWMRYIAGLTPPPTLDTMPAVFAQWAMLNAPMVLGPGRSALQAALLDPIFAAQVAAANTKAFVNNTPNFSQGAQQLFQQVAAASGAAFSFDSATASSDVSNTWCQGNCGALFGIFGSSDATTSQLTQQFASARVTGTVSFQKMTTFVASPAGLPGGWYSSAALGAAYEASTGGAPWSSGANPNWATTFGPGGNMARFLSALVVVDGMDVTINSAAHYSSSQQTTITQSADVGFWPFIWGSETSTTTRTVTFNADSTMSYHLTSPIGSPQVIGAFVLPASQYLGGNPQLSALVVPSRR